MSTDSMSTDSVSTDRVSADRAGQAPARPGGPGAHRSASVAVLLPCFNEELTVATVVADCRRILPAAHVYVYDNNSTDRSAAIVESLAARDGKVHLRREPRQGKGNVIRSMFREIDADCYVMLDADDTYPVESCPEMVGLVLGGSADMVLGDRLTTTYARENTRALHLAGNLLVRRLVNTLFSAQVNDVMTGQRAFSRRCVQGLTLTSTGFAVETEMTIHAVRRRMRIRHVPVRYRERRPGSLSKLRTVRDGAAVLATIVGLFRRHRPVAFFGGVLALLGAGVVAGRAALPRSASPADPRRIGSTPGEGGR